MTNSHGSFIWYELMTRDAEAAGRFYSAANPAWTFGQPMLGEINYRAIAVSGGGNPGGVLQLHDSMRSQGAAPTWLGYIGVDDVDDTVAKAIAAGAKALMEPFDIPAVGRIAMLADPAGAPFYVMRGASEESSDAFSPNAVGHCAWNELVTTDLAGAKEFYPALFGWTLGDAMPMGPMGDYQFIDHDGRMIGAMFAPGDRQPAWRFCFRTESLERSIEAVKAGGGEVLFGPTEVPGGGVIIQATDPEGVFFMLIEGGQS